MENKKIIQTILFSARLALLNTFSQGKAHASMALRSPMCQLLYLKCTLREYGNVVAPQKYLNKFGLLFGLH